MARLARMARVSHMATALALAIFMAAVPAATAHAAPIGSWKAYMAYHDVEHVVKAGTNVYVLASSDLYVYDTSDQSVTALDKMTGLSDSSIGFIAWSQAAKRLIIVYANGNIDLLEANGNVINVSDYYDKQLTVDKTVNGVSVVGNRAYLATAFGVVVINMSNATVADTYTINSSVNAVVVEGNYIYAATDSGVLRANTADNLSDHSSWQPFADEGFNWLFWKDGTLVGAKCYNISTIDATGKVTKQAGPYISFCTMQNNMLFACGGNDTYVYNSPSDRGLVSKSITDVAWDSTDGAYWTSDTDGSLCQMAIADDRSFTIKTTGIRPDGPKYNYFEYMFFHNDQLYTSGGQGYTSRPACVQVLGNDGRWNVYDDSFASTLQGRYRSAYAIALDPKDDRHLYMGAQSGLYEFYDGVFTKCWNMDNSPLWYPPSITSTKSRYSYNKVTALTTSPDGRLWCFNSETADCKSSLLTLSGTEWTDLGNRLFKTSKDYSLAYARSMFFDRRGLLWFCNNHSTDACFVCYQPETDAIKVYKEIVNQDGTKYTIYAVTCVVQDSEGNIWIGTDVGPFMLPASQIGTDDATLTQVKIPRNDGTNLADYLLSNVSITCIYVDGAGRKWFGTSGSGVYLISADNINQIQHFTRTNSQLLSNDIEAITCNEATGEVFFGTSEGLCSYMGDATTPSDNMTKDNVYAYPNPVTPDYTGLITITGLTLDADVKIVTSNGTLVAEGRSNGGSFTWDGNDRKGKRVASGVYMVETATSSGGKGTVCKIAVVN